MLTSAQLRAARALVGIDQRGLAEQAGVSLPTVQRMESFGNDRVKGVVETLVKVMEALERLGVDFINENATSHGGGRGVRLRQPANPSPPPT
jgi:predicted transcriptional regulator